MTKENFFSQIHYTKWVKKNKSKVLAAQTKPVVLKENPTEDFCQSQSESEANNEFSR